MPDAADAIRILLIRPWTEPLAPLRAALEEVGLVARFHRVDIEPALHAALHRGGYHVIVHDPRTSGITPAMIEACQRDHRRAIPIVTLGDVGTAAAEIQQALRSRRN